MAVRLPRFVMRQNVALRLFVQGIDVVFGEVNRFHPVTRGVSYYRGASTRCAARDQHRHQAYG